MTIIDLSVTSLEWWAINIASLFVILSLLAATYRLLIGPTLADRVVALDMLSMLMVVFLVLFSQVSGVNAYMYAAISLALIAFLATVAFAHYIDRTRGDSDD